MKTDIYQEVTDRIIAQLEKGIIPWKRPWSSTGLSVSVSHSTGKPYSLLNQLMIDRPGEFLTFGQCKKEGGTVKKGAKAHMVVFWKFLEVEDEQTGEKKSVPYLRYFNVFHIDDCEGIKAKHPDFKPDPMPNGVTPDEQAESIISGYLDRSGVKLFHEKGTRAYYQPGTDSITLPLVEQFELTSEYYSTAFHEMTHSTGHKSRLNRLNTTAHFGSKDYSKEELVAEIGAATLTNIAGLETESSFQNSAAYIDSWLKALKNDKRLIVSAAGKAEKAVNLILNRTPAAE